MASRTTATNGNAPWTTAERALSGDDATSTIAAASIEPTPAKTRAAPTGVPPELDEPDPHPGHDRQEEVVEPLVERQDFGGLGLLQRGAERGAGPRRRPLQRLEHEDVDVQHAPPVRGE